jgi:DNA-binding IclR family transcriptional regulator
MLGTLLGNQIIIIEQLASFQFIKFTTEIGRRVSIHASAPGKAILAFLPKDYQEKLINQITFKRYTDHTIPSKNGLIKELVKIKKLGYAIDDGEEVPDCHCVGSPIFDYRGYPIASLWTVGPSFRLTGDLYDQVGPIVNNYAMKISRRFGYDPVE